MMKSYFTCKSQSFSETNAIYQLVGNFPPSYNLF